MQTQTTLETARGIAGVEVHPGYSLIVVRGVGDAFERLDEALAFLNKAQFSIDFLKLGKGDFAFLVPEVEQAKVVDLLNAKGFDASHHRHKSIIKVKAPNIRDEGGLAARIAQLVLECGALIYCVGDMHDGVLVAVQSEKAESVAEKLRGCIGILDLA